MSKTVKEIIADSGHNLNFEVVEMLEKNKWNVEIGQYYVDDITDKPREIDIVASKTIRADEFARDGYDPARGDFYVNLFIECKYFKELTVFWMRDKNPEKTLEAFKVEGMNLEQFLEVSQEKPHYFDFKTRVGKLFDGPVQKDVMDAATTPLKSLTFFRDSRHQKGLYYPVVVYDGPGKLFNQDKGQEKNVIFEMNYSYRGRDGRIKEKEIFYIEFVPKEIFISFLTAIEKDIQQVRRVESHAYVQRMKSPPDRGISPHSEVR